MGGRGQRLEPQRRVGWNPPPKLGRKCDAQPAFFGHDIQHSRWLKQLRRLHNYANWARVNFGNASSAQVVHGLDLWNSILRAPGFCPSFQTWWTGRHCVGLGDPGFVPSQMPDAVLAQHFCEVFCCEVRYLESQLRQNRRARRKWQHQMDSNHIFKETKRPPPEPVTSLLDVTRTQVAEVDSDDCAAVVDPPELLMIPNQSKLMAVLSTSFMPLIPNFIWILLMGFLQVRSCHSPGIWAPCQNCLMLSVNSGKNVGVVMMACHVLIGMRSSLLLSSTCPATQLSIFSSHQSSCVLKQAERRSDQRAVLMEFPAGSSHCGSFCSGLLVWSL